MKEIIGNKIKQLRTCHHLNQKELAHEIQVTQASLSLYESGQKLPAVDVLTRIAKFFDVSLDWLCNIETPINFSNGADFINMFLKIKEMPHFNYEIDAKPAPSALFEVRYTLTLKFSGKSEIIPSSDGSNEKNLEKKFTVNAFAKFMEDYKDLETKLKTLGDNELSADYKKMWLEKKLLEYSKYKIINPED